MQKIMFNDKFQLTKAVLEGRKTQTRRVVRCPRTFKGEDVRGFYVYRRETDSEILMCACMHDADGFEIEGGEILPRYKVGEIVAIAQSYSDIGIERFAFSEAGWRNKMFVRAELMPRQIKITNVWLEHLQDISEEDCLAEGIIAKWHAPVGRKYYYLTDPDAGIRYEVNSSAREAYATLIDKVSGKGTWGNNPLVFVYEFELIK